MAGTNLPPGIHCGGRSVFRVLALAAGTYPERLDEDLSKLPYLGTLLKDA